MRAQWVCSRERRIALYKRTSINQKSWALTCDDWLVWATAVFRSCWVTEYSVAVHSSPEVPQNGPDAAGISVSVDWWSFQCNAVQAAWFWSCFILFLSQPFQVGLPHMLLFQSPHDLHDAQPGEWTWPSQSQAESWTLIISAVICYTCLWVVLSIKAADWTWVEWPVNCFQWPAERLQRPRALLWVELN